jgi:hypothetical protein
MTPGTPVCLSGRLIDRSPKASQHRHTTILDTKHTPSQAQTTNSLSMPQPIIYTISPSTHSSIARPTPLPGTSSCFSINVFRPLAKPMSTASHHHSPQLLLLASVVCQRLPALPTTILCPFPSCSKFRCASAGTARCGFEIDFGMDGYLLGPGLDARRDSLPHASKLVFHAWRAFSWSHASTFH